MMKQYKAQQHLMQMRALASLVEIFNTKNIDYRILKGILLNHLLYRNQLVRYSSDIDILIHLEDIHIIHEALSQQGYQLKQSHAMIQLLSQPGYLSRYMDQLTYWHPKTRVLLDVQWHLSSINCMGFTLNQFPQFDEQIMYHQPIKSLTPEQNFYYLCLHGAKHLWERRQWLDDLAAFQKNVTYCHDEVLALAKTSYTIRSLLEAKYLLKRHHGIELKPIPHGLRDRLMVKFRMNFIFFRKPHKYTTLFLTPFLLAHLAQLKHYFIRTLLLRTTCLSLIVELQTPTLFQVIWSSIVKKRSSFVR